MNKTIASNQKKGKQSANIGVDSLKFSCAFLLKLSKPMDSQIRHLPAESIAMALTEFMFASMVLGNPPHETMSD